MSFTSMRVLQMRVLLQIDSIRIIGGRAQGDFYTTLQLLLKDRAGCWRMIIYSYLKNVALLSLTLLIFQHLTSKNLESRKVQSRREFYPKMNGRKRWG